MPINLLSDVDVVAISIVKQGANRKRFYLRKAEDNDVLFESPGSKIVKMSDWSVVYCVVAEPDSAEGPGVGDGLGSGIDDRWASEDEIRKAAHKFMKNGALVNKMHETLEPYGQVVENFVSQADFAVDGEVILKGSWVIGLEPTADGKQLIESGEFTGVSIEGTGIRTLQKDSGYSGDSKKCKKCGGTVAAGRKTCHNCGYSFASMKKRTFTEPQRQALATKGHAMPDGGFPIENLQDLHNAIHLWAHASNPAAARKHIIASAKRLGATKMLPASWQLGARKIKKTLGPPGTDISRNQGKQFGPLHNLIAYYLKKKHPFAACVRDNRKRFGPDTERVCAALKDIGLQTTHWRHGGTIKKLDDLPQELVPIEIVKAMEDNWYSEGLNDEDAIVALEMALETEDRTLLSKIADKLGISPIDEEPNDNQEDDVPLTDEQTAALAKVGELETTVSELVKDDGRLAGIESSLAAIAKSLEESKPDPKEPTADEKRDELEKKVNELADSLIKAQDDLDALAEGSSSQETDDKTKIAKRDDKAELAHALFG
jgi:hypothetical protein